MNAQAASNKPTVFISSRIDELGIDRHAAWNAFYAADLTPLLFESEPQHSAPLVMNHMLDRADRFVGIYYRSLGPRDAGLGELTPIEYEFFYFLLKCLYENEGSHGRERVKQVLQNAADLRAVKYDLQLGLTTLVCGPSGSDDLAERPRAFAKIVKERMFVALKVHHEEHRCSSRLTDFLRLMPVTDWYSQGIERGSAWHVHMYRSGSTPVRGSAINAQCFVPAHVVLFDTLHELGKAWKVAYDSARSSNKRNGAKARSHGSSAQKEQRVLLTANSNPPGLLHAALEVMFEEGLNIEDLRVSSVAGDGAWSTRTDSEATRVAIYLRASPYHDIFDASEGRKAAEQKAASMWRAIKQRASDRLHSVTMASRPNDGLLNAVSVLIQSEESGDLLDEYKKHAGRLKRAGGDGGEHLVVIHVDVHHVPGTMMSVTDRLQSHGVNVISAELASSNDPPQRTGRRCRRLKLTVDLSEGHGSAVGKRDEKLERLLYMLRAMIGVDSCHQVDQGFASFAATRSEGTPRPARTKARQASKVVVPVRRRVKRSSGVVTPMPNRKGDRAGGASSANRRKTRKGD